MKSSRYGIEGLCRAAGLPVPIAEYRFAPPRRWRFDYAWPDPKHMIALEIDGGIWTQGRHTRGAGRLGDMEKQNAGALLGWRILYATPADVRSLAVLDLLARAFERGATPGPVKAEGGVGRRRGGVPTLPSRF